MLPGYLLLMQQKHNNKKIDKNNIGDNVSCPKQNIIEMYTTKMNQEKN